MARMVCSATIRSAGRSFCRGSNRSWSSLARYPRASQRLALTGSFSQTAWTQAPNDDMRSCMQLPPNAPSQGLQMPQGE